MEQISSGIVLIMATSGWIEGEGIIGREEIKPRQICQPDEQSFSAGLPFSRIVKVFSPGNHEQVLRPSNASKIKGNKKKYDEDSKCKFTWWSMAVDEHVLSIIKENVRSGGDVFEIYDRDTTNKSRYGTKRLTLNFDDVVAKYEQCAEKKSEIRVLGSYKYKKELMHAFVISPVDEPRFANHPLVGVNENLKWPQNGFALEKNAPGNYTYYPWSVIEFDH